MPPKDKYSDPKLRDEVKEEIHNSDKGGAPGQWSARKAQMMAQEYKRRGGGYNQEKSQQDESQKNLSKWGEEEWQTKEGSGDAKKQDGTQKRYLPKKAWEEMTEEEKEETDKKKQKESKKGRQFVQNTDKAKQSRKKANDEEHEKYEEKKAQEKADAEDEEDEEEVEDAEDAADDDADDYEEDEAAADEDGEEDDEGDADAEEEKADEQRAKTGSKRKATTQAKGSAKSQKKSTNGKSGGNAPAGKVGSKHMDDKEPAPRGSSDRLPKKGQNVTWKAMPGFVDGKVKEILTKGKKVDGKDVKASKEDPKIVLTSNSSGKVCVHKPDACFYE